MENFNNNNSISSAAPVASGASSAASTGADSAKGSSESFFVPMGQMAFIVGALQDMLKYSVDQARLFSDSQKSSSLTLIGGSIDENGKLTVDLNKGIISCLHQAQIDSGTEEANALKASAFGHWGAMGSNLGALGVTGGMAAKTSIDSRSPQAELNNLTAFKTELNNSSSSIGLEEALSTNVEVPTTTVDAQIQKYKEGNFEPVETRLQEATMRRLKNTDAKENLEKVQSSLEDKIKDAKGRLDSVQASFQNRSQYTSQAAQAGSSGFVAASEGMQADHREAKAKDDAAVAVLQIVQQQYSSNVDKARDAADAAKQEAAQAANAMAQIQNIRG